MCTNKIKGIYKGFKHIIQIFGTKERELEIGEPTDVKHVAHIGWDGTTGNPPSWMSGFNTSHEFSSVKACGGCATNNGIPRGSNNSMFFSPLLPQDLNINSTRRHPLPGSCTLDYTMPSSNQSSKPKKQRRKKKTKSSASKGSSTSSSLSKSLRLSNSKSGFHELEPNMAILGT